MSGRAELELQFSNFFVFILCPTRCLKLFQFKSFRNICVWSGLGSVKNCERTMGYTLEVSMLFFIVLVEAEEAHNQNK